MAKDYTYRNLILWQRAQTLAVQIITIVQQLPAGWGNAVVARQVIASATSISANIAEGHGRYTVRAHRNHLSIARGSAAETDNWIDLLRRLGYLSHEEEQALHAECCWIMQSLKSKILDLEHVEHDQQGSLKDASAPYVATSSLDDDSAPSWPFVTTDYV
jgi:four helix bundle protein